MNSLYEVWSPAKVNLFLELKARRNDGFHELETVMMTVGLYDRLIFAGRSDSQIKIALLPTGAAAVRSSCPAADKSHTTLLDNKSGDASPLSHTESQTAEPLPVDQRNLIWQAIEALRNKTGHAFGVDVWVEKRIPMQAGLGGGSSNTVSTLLALNHGCGLGLDRKSLIDIANQLGSDQAFFFHEPVAVCRGRGEQVQPLRSQMRAWFVIAKPPVGLSTAEVFRHSTLDHTALDHSVESSDSLQQAIASGRLREVGRCLRNRLQQAAQSLCPWIEKLSREFSKLNTLGHVMSGSGSSYFGLFAQRRLALAAEQTLRSRLPGVETACVSNRGPVVFHNHSSGRPTSFPSFFLENPSDP